LSARFPLLDTMAMTNPQSITQAASAIHTGILSPSDLVDQCLAQIDNYEKRLHAWVVVDAENARRTADELGREARADNYRGLLHGIPIGIKDIIDVAGMPTRAGSPLRENQPAATADAPLVAALRRSGAIILGKTVTVEFACFDPSPTRNPWDAELRHTPGGSSSGSAVAVAMGMCFGALGTQTGGSLVRPASYCGIATLKPTFGLLSREGIVPVSYHFDHPGPMARTTTDLEILMQCLLGDSWINSPLPLGEGKGEGVSRPPRLGVLQTFFMDEAHPAVREVIEETIAKLRNSGAEIKRLEIKSPLPLGEGQGEGISSHGNTPLDFAEVAAMHRRIMAVEAAEYHRQQFADNRHKYGPKITSLLDEGLKILAVDYASALAWQREFRLRVSGLFADCDALLVPSTDTTAPATLETTGTPKFQAPWSCAGVPVVSIPCGLASDGMPVGLQLVGRENQDEALLVTAEWCEKAIDFGKTPVLLDKP
jgi:Asp-tRNA(Asn)/Glu-tRNA(Gln) amidotransferase A subunit family amidase